MAKKISKAAHLLSPIDHRLRRVSVRNLALTYLFFIPIACGILSLYLGQDANWDLRNYHWYNAYALLNHRHGIDLLPAQTPTFYNPAIDIPFYILATHAPARVAGFMLGFVQGLNGILLFMLAYVSITMANPRHKVLACASISTLGVIGGGGLALLGATFYDNVTSLGVFLSTLLILRHYPTLIENTWQRSFGRIFLFALPAGLMVGLKLPAAIFCSGICIGLLFMPGRFQRRLSLAFGFGLGVIFGAIFTLGPWAFFLYENFGNPLFPYFNGFFHSPLAPPVSGRDIQFVPSSFSDFIFFPFIFTHYPLRVGEIPWRDLRIVILYCVLPAAVLLRLFFGRTKTQGDAIASLHAQRLLLWGGIVSYLVWLLFFCIYRYLVPFEMLTPLLLVLAIDLLPLCASSRRLLTVIVFVIIAATIQPGNWYRRSSWLDHYVTVELPSLGDTSKLMLLMAGFEPYSHVVTQFPAFIPIVRIQSNFASPDQDKGINRVVHERVASHMAQHGRFLMLIPPWQHVLAQNALVFFGLTLSTDACQKVVDRLYDDMTLDLCAVDVVSPAPAPK